MSIYTYTPDWYSLLADSLQPFPEGVPRERLCRRYRLLAAIPSMEASAASAIIWLCFVPDFQGEQIGSIVYRCYIYIY